VLDISILKHISCISSFNIVMGEGADLSTLQAWLASLLGGGVPDWEVTPETVDLLRQLHTVNTRQDRAGQLELEQIQQVTAEYEAEAGRIKGQLNRTTGGCEAEVFKGPAREYTEVLVGLSHKLGVDSSLGPELETSLCSLVSEEAELTCSVLRTTQALAAARSRVKGVCHQLSRLGEVSQGARQEAVGQLQETETKQRNAEWVAGKCREYSRQGEKGHHQLLRVQGQDKGATHGNIVQLRANLEKLEGELEPLEREQAGYLALPPSLELARVEVERSRHELEELEGKLSSAIAGLHI